MNKGISFYFGYANTLIEERVKQIKNAGFDCVITNADKHLNKQNGTIKQQTKLFKKYGMKLSSLHMTYSVNELPYFWQDCKLGDVLENRLMKDVKIAHKYGYLCVVVHLVGDETSEIGFNRLKRILKYCEKVNVPIAIENVDYPKILHQTFQNIQSDYLKFCYDSGHNNIFDPETDYLTMYKDKLIALHLHDNLGVNVTNEELEKLNNFSHNKDMHTLNKYGNINWNTIAKKLAKLNNDINLDYEIKMLSNNNETAEQTLDAVYFQACQLEEKINYYKNKK